MAYSVPANPEWDLQGLLDKVPDLDLGGELAELDLLKRPVTLKFAVKLLKARTISELSNLLPRPRADGGRLHRGLVPQRGPHLSYM